MFDINADPPAELAPLAKAHPAQDALKKRRLVPVAAWPRSTAPGAPAPAPADDPAQPAD
jgi:hypothetical protein